MSAFEKRVPQGQRVFLGGFAPNITNAVASETRKESMAQHHECGGFIPISRPVNDQRVLAVSCIFCRQPALVFPDCPEAILFGDESLRGELALYGIVNVRTSCADRLRIQIGDLIENAVGRRLTLHASVMFNYDRRKNSAWQILNKKGCWDLVFSVFRIVMQNQAVFSIGAAHGSWFPKSLKHWNGETLLLDEKHLHQQASIAAIMMLVESRFVRPGHKTRFVVDYCNSKVDQWGLGSSQIQKEFGDDLVQLSRIERESEILLSLPDVLIWAYGKSINAQSSAEAREHCRELVRMCNPFVTHSYFGRCLQYPIGSDSWVPEIVEDGRDLKAISAFVGESIY